MAISEIPGYPFQSGDRLNHDTMNAIVDCLLRNGLAMGTLVPHIQTPSGVVLGPGGGSGGAGAVRIKTTSQITARSGAVAGSGYGVLVLLGTGLQYVDGTEGITLLNFSDTPFTTPHLYGWAVPVYSPDYSNTYEIISLECA